MDTFFLNELKKCCADINSDKENASGISEVHEAYKRIRVFADLARSEGLLALSEACENLNQGDAAEGFLSRQIMQIVDGIEPRIVTETGMNEIAADDNVSYKKLVMLIYHKAAVMIQAGVSINTLRVYIQSMLPVFLREALLKKEDEEEKARQQKKNDDSSKWVRALCEDNRVIDERDYSIINQTALLLLELSDAEIQRILRETENKDIVTAMIELPGRARARIFDNTSKRLGEMLAHDVMCRGTVSLSEIEKACVTIVKTVIKLEADGEIAHHNLTVLKFVIGIYDISDMTKNNGL